MPAPLQPIIIVKKKVHGHGGHHGGAWKVAYADFVTAMMALFIVLWLMNSKPDVQQAVSGYFKDPAGFANHKGTDMSGAGQGINLSETDMKNLKEKLEDAIRKAPQFQKLKDDVEITITGEGLRIELIEGEKGTFFGSGDSKPTSMCRDLITKLAAELAKLENPIMVEGHTDSTKYGTDVYTNWELSADRANTARRILRDGGLAPGRIKQVRGFADQQPRFPKEPDNPRNRRISVIVAYPHVEDKNDVPKEKGKGGEHGDGGEHGKAPEPTKPAENAKEGEHGKAPKSSKPAEQTKSGEHGKEAANPAHGGH